MKPTENKTQRFNSQYNFKTDSLHLEKVTGESETVQGDSYTIQELMQKHTQGIMPPVGKQPYYDENPDIDNPDITRRPDFDLSDVTENQIKLENLADLYKEQQVQLKLKQTKKQQQKTKELEDKIKLLEKYQHQNPLKED